MASKHLTLVCTCSATWKKKHSIAEEFEKFIEPPENTKNVQSNNIKQVTTVDSMSQDHTFFYK